MFWFGGCPCELTKVIPDQINLGRKPVEHLSRCVEVANLREGFQLVRGFLRGRGLKCSNGAFECVSRALDHHRVTRIKAVSDLLFLPRAVRKPQLRHLCQKSSISHNRVEKQLELTNCPKRLLFGRLNLVSCFAHFGHCSLQLVNSNRL